MPRHPIVTAPRMPQDAPVSDRSDNRTAPHIVAPAPSQGQDDTPHPRGGGGPPEAAVPRAPRSPSDASAAQIFGTSREVVSGTRFGGGPALNPASRPGGDDIGHDDGPDSAQEFGGTRSDGGGPAHAFIPSSADAHRISALGCASWDSLKVAARTDPDLFMEFVLREKTASTVEIPGRGIQGDPVVQHRIHVEMQAAVTEHLHVVIEGHPECGKTMQIGVGRALMAIGRNVDTQGALIGNTQGAAAKTLTSIKTYIERSDEYRAVFPKVRPGGLWTSTAITVERMSASRDPTVQTVGYHGDILGSRLHWWVADDFLDHENTRTEEARREAETWFRRSVLTRELDGAWGAFLTNSWHERDMTASLKRDGWKKLVFPVLDEHGQPTWPERWPLHRIKARIPIIGVSDYVRLFLCKPRDDSSRTFMPEAVELCFENGRGYTLMEHISDDLEAGGALVITGVDIGASRRRGGKTVLSTLAIHPDRRTQVLALRSGRGGSSWLFEQMADVAERFAGVMVVENNGIQKMVVEVAQQRGEDIAVPIYPFQTNRNKYAPETGIPTMAAEFDVGKWILPEQDNIEMQELAMDLDSYDPEMHTGDHLMATWMARTYGRRLMRRATGEPTGSITVHAAGDRERGRSIDSSVRRAVVRRDLEHAMAKETDAVAKAMMTLELVKLQRREAARSGAITLEDLRIDT